MIPLVSYGTVQKHSNSVKRLRESCEKLSYPHLIEVIPDKFFKEDRLKYLYKPTFIRESLEKLKCPIIWMDVDSYLTAIPKIGKLDFDFGYIKSPPGSHKWFADSCHIHAPSNIPFLKQWEAFCLEEKGISDHTQLIRTFDFMEGKFKPKDVSNWFKGCYIRNYKRYDEIHY